MGFVGLEKTDEFGTFVTRAYGEKGILPTSFFIGNHLGFSILSRLFLALDFIHLQINDVGAS